MRGEREPRCPAHSPAALLPSGLAGRWLRQEALCLLITAELSDENSTCGPVRAELSRSRRRAGDEDTSSAYGVERSAAEAAQELLSRPHLADQEAKAQREGAACPGSHSS